MNIVLAIIVLSVIIIVHEFGHFILAKANGVMVMEFCIGFGPKLVSFKKGETVYSIKLLPFGGACIMLGEDFLDTEDEAEEGESEETSDNSAEKSVKEKYDMSRSFPAQSVWARMSILAAGPVFNFILAFVLSVIIIGFAGYDPCEVSAVADNSPASSAGLEAGDLITKINGHRVTFSRDLSLETLMHPDRTLNITYERDGQKYTAKVVPEYQKKVSYMTGITILSDCSIQTVENDSPAKKGGIKAGDKIKSIQGTEIENTQQIVDIIAACDGSEQTIVVERDGKELTLKVTPQMKERESYYTGLYSYGARQKAGALSTVGYAFKDVGYWIRTVFGSLGMMFRGQVSLDDVSGPVGVVSVIGDVVEESKSDGAFYVLLNLFNMTVMISANLGVMNLLPLPALDGGRLLFVILEILRGKPVAKEKEGIVHFAGMILLMILMVVVMFNDIKNLF